MFFEIKGKNDSKMAIKYKIKLRDLKLEYLKEYIAPIFNFLKPKKKITNISELKNFIPKKVSVGFARNFVWLSKN